MAQLILYIEKNEIRKRAKLISHQKLLCSSHYFLLSILNFIFHVYSSFIHYNPTKHFTSHLYILRIQWNKNNILHVLFLHKIKMRCQIQYNIVYRIVYVWSCGYVNCQLSTFSCVNPFFFIIIRIRKGELAIGTS